MLQKYVILLPEILRKNGNATGADNNIQLCVGHIYFLCYNYFI